MSDHPAPAGVPDQTPDPTIDPEGTDAEQATTDPKELMRLALERKKNARHQSHDAVAGGRQSAAGPHGQAGAKRQFRRKSGG